MTSHLAKADPEVMDAIRRETERQKHNLELIMSLEEEFGMEISDEEAEKIVTVQDAVDYISEHLD